MTHPRCGLAAAPPSRGRRQRTGRAGSAAAAWLAPRALGVLLGLLAAACLQPALAGDGSSLQPAIERATKGERCVADPAFMRRNHMDLLKHQRDDTVHGGIRGAKFSLKECIGCHAGAKTGSVAQAPTDFCVSCHSYTAVSIDCFECHSSRPAAVATRATP